MKKNFLFLFIFQLFFIGNIAAQWSVGISSGINQSRITGYQFGDGKHISGMTANVFGYKKLNKYLEFGFELGIAQRGTENVHFEFDDFIILSPRISLINSIVPTNLGDIQSTYIQLPVLIKANAPLSKNKFYFITKAGLGPSWMATAYVKPIIIGETGNGAIEKVNFKNSTEFNRWDIGFYGSVGLQFNFLKGQLFSTLDTYIGFLGINDNGVEKNRSRGFSIGYLVEL